MCLLDFQVHQCGHRGILLSVLGFYFDTHQNTSYSMKLDKIYTAPFALSAGDTSSAANSQSMQRTILVIDDEPEKSLPLVEHLRHEGYRVLFADSGAQGLEFIAAEKPEMVICDLEMPDMGGYQVMEAMSTTLNMRHLAFIIMNETFDMTNWSRFVGGRTADCHLPKPVIPREVAAFARRIFQSIEEDTEQETD